MRLVRASVLFFFFICPFCFGQTADSPDSAAAVNSSEQPTPNKKVAIREQRMSPGRSWNESVRQKLKKRFDLNYDGISWREIEKELETKFGFNIELDSSAIGDSLSYDEPFTANLTGLSLGNGLQMLLKDKNATFIIKDEQVLIISLDDVENIENFSHFFINLRPLLATIAELEKDRIGHRVAPNRDAQKSRTTETARQPVEFISAESLLLDAVHTYRFDNWRESGKGLVTISIIGGYAVVHCNDEFAGSLRDFLTDLEYHISRN